MSIEQMRAKISVMYQGTWADRVAKMSDAQVYSIYQRQLNKERQKEKI